MQVTSTYMRISFYHVSSIEFKLSNIELSWLSIELKLSSIDLSW